MGWLSRLFGISPPAPALFIEWREASFPTCAVGESFYQPALEALCGGHHSRSSVDVECEAALIPEPNNPYDANAVKVTVQGKLVAHLSRADAISFHERMAAAGHAGRGARCAARINGGWRTNQYDEGSFGIRLAIPGWGPFTIK